MPSRSRRSRPAFATAAFADAATRLWQIPASRRAGVLVRALACFPEISLEASFVSGWLRAALSSAWEAMDGTAMPVESLRQRLEERDDEQMVSAICGVAFAESPTGIRECLTAALGRLMEMRTQDTALERWKDGPR